MSEKVASPNGFLSTPASSSSANPAFDVAMSIDKPAGDTASSMNPLPHHDSPPSSQGAPGRYNTLPTPYSPNQFAQYSFPHTPESPLPPSGTRPSFDGSRQLGDYGNNQTPRHVQMITPDSSPFGSRIVSNSAPQPSSRPPTTLPSSIPFRLAGSPTTSPPESVRSQATSPFMAKLLAAERQQRLSTPTSGPGPMQVDDVFSSSSRMTRVPTLPSISTPPTSPPLNISLSSTTPIPGAASHFSPPLSGSGGEIERIRYAIAQEQHELETRRPDYLQRHRRPESETPSSVETSEIPVHPSVGILESPTKGRRIKLFQETSEESFEESLMAGGYGRYRTAEWVRQPQPLLLTTPGSAGPSKMLSALEEVEEPKPLTEKEQKKRKRLDAFRSSSASHNGPSTLFPVELEGKGRVLLDIPNESVVEIHPRKRAATRRRKKGDAAKDALALSAPEEHVDIPNWPDAEFPWRLRTEERTELAKAEERERLTWIEKFLERDTDDEDDGEVDSAGREEEGDEAVIPSSKWGIVYEDATDRPTPARRGRGKMIPLSADPAAATNLNMERRRRSYFPSDPADARAALLSKRSVRALSYRREKRLRTAGHRRGQDRLCLCRGTDDGRELVQCDDCKMWYHLQCLGIRETSELGPEEEPWYCHDCNSGSRPSSPEPEDAEMPYREPTFAPTDETPRIRRTYDAPFLHSSGLQDSPLPSWNATRLPRTPVRGSRGSDGDVLTMAPPDPRYETPRNRRGPGDGYYDDLPFDPTSTPSRGIKLVPQPGFATPKTSLFSRSNGPFQTPRRPSGGGSRMPGPVSSVSSLDESPYGRFPVSGFPYDDSPVRHNTRRGSLEGPPPPRRVL